VVPGDGMSMGPAADVVLDSVAVVVMLLLLLLLLLMTVWFAPLALDHAWS
jgi:hypothetical protein